MFIFLTDQSSDFAVSLFRIEPNNKGVVRSQSNSAALGDKLSFMVKLETENTNVRMAVQNCYATDAGSTPRFDLVENR